MQTNIGRKNIRKKRTKQALYTALPTLLKNRSFKKITVTDICEEALISRATFYSYFWDKYELLQYWLMNLWAEKTNLDGTYEQLEKEFNHFVHNNELILKNLLYDVDNETMDILFDFILSTIQMPPKMCDHAGLDTKQVIFSNFYAGGMIFYLLWQIKNKFPAEVQPMNKFLYEVIGKLKSWNSKEP